MTEHFPILKKGQVALSRADVNTGIVLDEQYKYATNPSQKVYTIFDNSDEAVEMAKRIIGENRSIECYIHGENNNLLFNLDSKKIDDM